MSTQQPDRPQREAPKVPPGLPAPDPPLLHIDANVRTSAELRLAVTPIAIPALAKAARCEATLLFADLFGYSAFTEERELEHVSRAVGEIKRQAVRIVHGHGGIVNQFVGDEVMAIFGFPKGKEDAPRRAVEAALELHAFVRSTNLRQWLGQERKLQLHSGIDTGMVLIRTRDVRNGLFELTGSAVIRAARLRSAAAADELLVSPRVHERIASTFATEQRAAQHLKGSSERASVYRVLRRHTPAVELREPAPRPVSARSELSQLQRFWADRSSQRGGIVIVKGAAGSGKSRLLESFAGQLAHEEVVVWTSQGRSLDCEPFSALSRMVPRREKGASVALWSWPELLRELSERQALRPHLIHEHHTQDRVVRAAAALLCQRVEATTLRHAFIIDDLHWVDASTLAVIAQLAQRLCPQGAVFVCAVRDDEAHASLLERLRAAVQDELCAQITLGPLSMNDATGLVAEHLGLARLSGSQWIEQLTLLSDGTPLNLLELVHLLLEDKYLHAHNGDLQQRVPWESLASTPSARDLIERRIRTLSPDAAKLLQAFAVMREGVDHACLLRATRMTRARAQRAFDECAQARLIEQSASGEPSFAHDVIWETLLLGMPDAEQRDWQKRAALALRALPELSDKQRFTLARHCAAGLIEEDPQGTFEALHSAAQLARAAHDDALALSFLQPATRAAELASLRPSTELYAELGETAFRIGELQVALEAFQVAVSRLAPGAERAHLLGKLAFIHHFHASGSPAQMLEQALRECGEEVPRHKLGALYSAASAQLGRLSARASDPSSHKQQEIVCGLYIGLFRVYCDDGQLALAMAAGSQLLAAADRLGDCRTRAQADAMVGFFLGLLGLHSLSAARFERSRSTAHRLADPVSLAYYHQISQVFASYRGDFDAAERHAHECVVVRGQYMELSELCLVCLGQFTIELYRGRMDRALSWAFRAIERIQQYGHAPAVFSLIEEAVCGVFISHGMQEDVVRLKSRLRFVRRSELGGGGLYHLVTFMCRAPYVSSAELPNPGFEAMVAEFSALGLRAKQLPIGTAAYFVQVAHVRVTQCLRTNGSERRAYIDGLRKAICDVEATTRVPAMEAHADVLRAALAWFESDHATAERRLASAESLARSFGLPWVSFAAARLRAHMLRAQGKPDAALDQARVAALHAKQYGMKAQLQLISDELELTQSDCVTL
jgi:class 3 adenylate cyclase